MVLILRMVLMHSYKKAIINATYFLIWLPTPNLSFWEGWNTSTLGSESKILRYQVFSVLDISLV